MNERIKQLAEQAGEWYMANSKEFPSPRELNEKFAELIIRECADLANDAYDGDPYHHIMNHFGLE